MKNYVLLSLIVIGISPLINPLCAQHEKFAQIELENATTIATESWINPQINFFGTKTWNDSKWGCYYFSLVKPDWGQAYVGLSYQVLPWLNLNAGIGLETHDEPIRYNLGSFAATNNWTLSQIYEYGGSGFWYYITLNYKINPSFKMGLVAKRYLGVGPNFEFSIPNYPMVFQLSPVYDFEFDELRFMTVLRYIL